MRKRVTIIMDDDIMIKIRKLQCVMIKNSENAVSFSRTINEVLRLAMKK